MRGASRKQDASTSGHMTRQTSPIHKPIKKDLTQDVIKTHFGSEMSSVTFVFHYKAKEQNSNGKNARWGCVGPRCKEYHSQMHF
jgi:hypothetical protein